MPSPWINETARLRDRVRTRRRELLEDRKRQRGTRWYSPTGFHGFSVEKHGEF